MYRLHVFLCSFVFLLSFIFLLLYCFDVLLFCCCCCCCCFYFILVFYYLSTALLNSCNVIFYHDFTFIWTGPSCNFACLTAFTPLTDMCPVLCFTVYHSVCFVCKALCILLFIIIIIMIIIIIIIQTYGCCCQIAEARKHSTLTMPVVIFFPVHSLLTLTSKEEKVASCHFWCKHCTTMTAGHQKSKIVYPTNVTSSHKTFFLVNHYFSLSISPAGQGPFLSQRSTQSSTLSSQGLGIQIFVEVLSWSGHLSLAFTEWLQMIYFQMTCVAKDLIKQSSFVRGCRILLSTKVACLN